MFSAVILSSVLAVSPLENFENWSINSIEGISIGIREDEIPSKFRDSAVREKWTRSGHRLIFENIKISICEGKVVQINRDYDPDFFTFTKLVEKITEKHGQPQPEVFGTDISIPDKGDVRGGTLRFRWRKGPNYFLMWNERNGKTSFSENLVKIGLCHDQRWGRAT